MSDNAKKLMVALKYGSVGTFISFAVMILTVYYRFYSEEEAGQGNYVLCRGFDFPRVKIANILEHKMSEVRNLIGNCSIF